MALREVFQRGDFLAGPSVKQGLMPEVDNWLTRPLRELEDRYYARLPSPDATIVLQLDPEVAVRRKTDEPADYVRERAQVVWETDWQRIGARVVDADRPLPEVVGELKSLIWSLL